MKKYVLLLILSILMCDFVYAQKLEKNGTDKFTKKELKETSRETLCKKAVVGKGANMVLVRCQKVEETISLIFDLGTTEIENYGAEDGLTLLLDNNEVVNVKADKVGQSAVFEPVKVMGPGTCLFNITKSLGLEEIEKLSTHSIVAARINYEGGNKDFSVKKKDQSLVMSMLRLVR